jgi:HEAT repeat protein
MIIIGLTPFSKEMMRKFIEKPVCLFFVTLACFFFGCLDSRSSKLEKMQIVRKEIEKSDDAHLKSAFDGLMPFVNDRDDFIRANLALSLKQIGGQDYKRFAPYAVPMLLSLLMDDGFAVKKNAAQAVSRYKEKASSAIPLLEDIINKTPDTDAAWFAAEALGEIGEASTAAVPTLIKALEYEGEFKGLRYQLRTCAARGLAGIGPSAREALPTLRKYENTDDRMCQIEIKNAIRSLER